jgi:hypothetical protein
MHQFQGGSRSRGRSEMDLGCGTSTLELPERTRLCCRRAGNLELRIDKPK